MAAYRTWDSTGTAVSRGQPFATNIYIYNTPDYQSWQSELTVNGSALDDKLKWTTGLFYFTEQSPNDGGMLYLFLPSAGSAPSPSGRQADHGHRLEQEQRSRTVPMPAYAQADLQHLARHPADGRRPLYL